jgi:hypothetical protein
VEWLNVSVSKFFFLGFSVGQVWVNRSQFLSDKESRETIFMIKGSLNWRQKFREFNHTNFVAGSSAGNNKKAYGTVFHF